MNIASKQTGVGLIEVMVALLLLSIAILGYSALQAQAIKATDAYLYDPLYEPKAQNTIDDPDDNVEGPMGTIIK